MPGVRVDGHIYQLHKVISNCEDVLIQVATFLVFDKGELLESKDLASHLTDYTPLTLCARTP